MPTHVTTVTRVFTDTEQQILDQLAAAAAQRAKADTRTRALIRAGLSAGLPQTELAATAGVDRGVVARIRRTLTEAG